MLIGEYHHNLDNKGRLTLPSQFREELGEDIVITRGFENTLLVSILLSYADLTKECVIIGLGDHLEIWSLENWNAFYNSTKDKMSDIAENIYLGDKNETLSGDVK